MDNEIKIKVSADVSGLASLDSALASAQAQVKNAATSMAEAQLAFGKAAEQGSEQATAALTEYSTALDDARQKALALATIPAPAVAQGTVSESSSLDTGTAEAMSAEAAANQEVAESATVAYASINEEIAALVAQAAAARAAAQANAAMVAVDEDVIEGNEAVAASSVEVAAGAEEQVAAVGRSTEALEAYTLIARQGGEAARLLFQAYQEASAAGATFTEAQEAAVAAVDEFTAASERAAVATGELTLGMDAEATAASRGVSESIAATGALRTLEGSMMGSTRAAAAFLSTTLGLGPVIAAAFPIIGAVALGSILVDIGEKFFDVQKAAEDAAENIDESFRKANDDIRAANDSLLTQTDHLQAELDKLLGHPSQNGAKIALDEMTESANQLSIAIDRDMEKMNALVAATNKKNTVGFFGSLVTGKAETGDTQKLIQQQVDAIQAKNAEYQRPLELAEESGDKANVASVQQDQLVALQKVYADADAKITASLESLQKKQADFMETGFGEDQIANISLLAGALQMLAEQQKNIGEQYAKENVQGQVTAAQTAKAEAPAPVPELKVAPGKIAEALQRETEAARREVAKYQSVLDDLQEIDQKFAKAQDEAATAAQKAATEAAQKNAISAAEQQHTQAAGGLQLQESQVQSNATLGTTSHTQELEQLQTIHQQMVTEDEQFIAKEIAAYQPEADKYKAIQDQINAIHRQGLDFMESSTVESLQKQQEEYQKSYDKIEQLQKELTKEQQKAQEQQLQDTTKILEQEQEKYKQVYGVITSSFNSALMQWETHEKTAEQAFAQMLVSMETGVEKLVLEYLENKLLKSLEQLLGLDNGANNGSNANQSTATADKVLNPQIVESNAAAAASIAFLASGADPGAAAAAYAEGMIYFPLAAFEAGGVVAGASGMPVPIVAHAGERVLSAPQTQNFERMVNQPQGGGSQFHMHYNGQVNAFDRNGMRQTLQSHAEDILDIVKQGWNAGKLR